ncbi:MAG: hypothetical protein DDG60_15240 [Anaerolineae bacterium]|nr:MAG: hypothetical protein DDG60_15240 [Anaerolineae bacterium]
MSENRLKKRLQSLFEDIENLASHPNPDVTLMRRELDSLRARVAEIETQVDQWQASLHYQQVARRLGSSLSASLYEKEQVGFAWINGKLEPLRLAPLSKLDVQRVLYMPLTAENKSIGAIVVEPPAEKDTWHSDESTLVESLARQVSLQIQNLRLLQAAERARAEAQAATRRFAHESWASFLDAIHQNERIGYVYDQASVEPYTDPAPSETGIQATVSVLEQQIGRIVLEQDPANPLSEEDQALVSAVARQLGQQVENLRLLADAARARAEAEEATRRLTRESWKGYTEKKEKHSLGFLYDSNRVTPLEEVPQNITLAKPLVVRGEPIGELAIAGLDEVSPEMAALMDAIAAQTSLHLEALRLTEELQRRAEELQELDRLKSSFLANMSHELRTPLNSILGFTDVMLEGIDGPLTEYMENDLRLIQKNGQHLLSLINDVLDMAKIESGRMNLHPERFNLYDLIQNVMNITSALANAKNLTLFIEPDTDPALEITADETRIKQVLINVVNNAIKFTESGYISIHAACTGDDKILITVNDTGIGIPADHLEKIFQEFSQVDTSTTRKVGGTGLGLPISRRLVELHGGRMWAESAGIPGEGSTFYIELPIQAKITEIVEKRVR